MKYLHRVSKTPTVRMPCLATPSCINITKMCLNLKGDNQSALSRITFWLWKRVLFSHDICVAWMLECGLYYVIFLITEDSSLFLLFFKLARCVGPQLVQQALCWFYFCTKSVGLIFWLSTLHQPEVNINFSLFKIPPELPFTISCKWHLLCHSHSSRTSV